MDHNGWWERTCEIYVCKMWKHTFNYWKYQQQSNCVNSYCEAYGRKYQAGCHTTNVINFNLVKLLKVHYCGTRENCIYVLYKNSCFLKIHIYLLSVLYTYVCVCVSTRTWRPSFKTENLTEIKLSLIQQDIIFAIENCC